MPVASAGPLRRRVGVPTALTRAYRAGWCRARVESLARALGDSLVEAAGQQTQIAARSLAEPWPRSGGSLRSGRLPRPRAFTV